MFLTGNFPYFYWPKISGHDLLVGYESLYGISKDRAGATLTETNIDYENIGRSKTATSTGLNDSEIEFSADAIGTKDRTIVAWIYGNEINSNVKILHNGKLLFRGASSNRLLYSNNLSDYLISNNDAFTANQWNFVAILDGDSGIKLYVGDLESTPTLDKSLSASTPVAGISSLITMETDSPTVFKMPLVGAYENDMTLAQVVELYNFTKNYIK